jgi:NAD(P)H dehydrogenase (quinone)
MILITGATGNLGSKTIDHLINKGVEPSEISAFVRNEEKANDLKAKGVNLVIGDYSDYNSMVTGFKGVDKLLFVSGNEMDKRDKQHEDLINAAKEAGVGHIFYTSFMENPEVAETAIPFIYNTHKGTEKKIQESGLDYTFLKNGAYMESILMFAGDKVAETSTIMFPAGEGKASYVLIDDLAEATAQILTTDGHAGKSYPLANSEAVSYSDVSKELSGILGKQINYVSPEAGEYSNILKGANVPGEYIGFFLAFGAAQAQGELAVTDATLESFLGRKPATIKDFLPMVFQN